MPRKGFDKFLKVCDKELGHKYYIRGVMRGIYIDIAVFENAPDNKYIRLLDGVINLGIQFVASCIDIKDSVSYLKKVGIVLTYEEKLALRLKRIIGSVFGVVPAYRWYRFYNWYASKNKNDESQYVCSYAGYKNLIKSTFERNRLFPGILSQFEGKEWRIPRDSDYYLKTIYRDYMKLPPVENRKVHPVFELQFSDGTEL